MHRPMYIKFFKSYLHRPTHECEKATDPHWPMKLKCYLKCANVTILSKD